MAVTLQVRSLHPRSGLLGHLRPSSPASAVLAEVDAVRRDYRLREMSYGVNLAWKAAGGVEEPPKDLVLGFARQSVRVHHPGAHRRFGQTPDQIGALTAEILKMLLRRAVEAQRGRGDADGIEG